MVLLMVIDFTAVGSSSTISQAPDAGHIPADFDNADMPPPLRRAARWCADSQRHGLAHCNKLIMAMYSRLFNDESIVLCVCFHAPG